MQILGDGNLIIKMAILNNIFKFSVYTLWIIEMYVHAIICYRLNSYKFKNLAMRKVGIQ
ncbi:hypothetical protein bcgnr5380_12220 [Bacillus cereus]